MNTYSSFCILFLASILCSACGAGNKNSTTSNSTSKQNQEVSKACIDRVIALDDSLGTIRNHACESISLSKTIHQYVDALKQIDFQQCPTAFTAAFQKHLQAWSAMTLVTDKYPAMRGEMHDLFDIIEQGEHQAAFKPRLKAIWDTWKEIEIAMK